MSEVSERIEAVIVAASEGKVSAEKLHAVQGDLIKAGLDSLQILAVIMGLESEFGIVIDVNEDASFLMNLSTIAAFVEAQLQPEQAR